MPNLSAPAKRLLIVLHRWLGVALSLLFVAWFASGIVMIYWTYPEVTGKDRLIRATALDPGAIAVAPEDAYAALHRDQPPSSVHLTTLDRRPVYRFGGRDEAGGSGGALVFADDGAVLDKPDAAMLDRAAQAWVGRPARDATKESIVDVDQWTVGGPLRTLRPLYKYSWPSGEQVYVDGRTAAVVQYTTRSSRTWAYLGAIPHWLYFTPLRRHQAQWASLVVCLSLVGTIAALIGVVLAAWMYSPGKRYRYLATPTSIPYRGWKRWHMIAGLLFGMVTATWVFSGLLSMGPFATTDRLAQMTVGAADAFVEQSVSLESALRPGPAPLDAYARKTPPLALAAIPDFDARDLELMSFAGAPVYVATNGRGETQVVPVAGEARPAFAISDLIQIVRRSAGVRLSQVRVLPQYDAYYVDRRREQPLPVLYAELNDIGRTRYYIDPRTARVVGSYNERGWIDRWLYHGLHSVSLPWLYTRRPLWDIVVISLLAGGGALSATGIVLAWRVLLRTMARLARATRASPDEDLLVP